MSTLEDLAAPPEAAADLVERRRSPARVVAVAALVPALVLAGSGLLYLGAHAGGPAAANRALTDAQTTTEVVGDVGNALGKVFSYTPADTGATARAAGELLDGPAAAQYRTLFGQVQQQVVAQRLTLTSRVVRAGVVRLTADQAQLLVFLDQTSQREGKAATSAAAQLSVTARRQGGHWRIVELKAR
ncbi:hypothetical protein [Kitasatospora sp. McL0602]|uniref:hypothetical protein n=1 Tax=Kitasatospora sp. McL0602 TaxID=3439530 RepID=UPI003F8CC84D